MKHLCALLILGSSLIASAQVARVNTDFSGGIPSGFTTIDRSGKDVIVNNFMQSRKTVDGNSVYVPIDGVTPGNDWYTGQAVPEKGTERVYAALSCSHRLGAAATQTDNWLILPLTSISEGMSLRWRAKSIHHDLLEDYDVCISTRGIDPSDFQTLLSVRQEPATFTSHYIDLSPYAGTQAYVAFVHRSTYRFLLAVTDVNLDAPTAPQLEAHNNSRHFLTPEDDATIAFSVSNFGSRCTISSIQVASTENTCPVVGSLTGLDCELETGDTVHFEIPVEIATGEAYKYEVTVQTSVGKSYTLLSDVLNRSPYQQKMFMEKYTGFWCNSCPRANLPVYRIRERLGDECVYLEMHNSLAGSDPVAFNEYVSTMPENTYYKVVGDWPALWFNRTQQAPVGTKPQDMTAFETALHTICTTGLNLTYTRGNDNTVTARAEVTFAEDVDNTDGHLRLSLAVTENRIEPTGTDKQRNGIGGMGAWLGELHFCPSPVATVFTPLHDVVRCPETGATGIEGLLPAEMLLAGQKYVCTHTVTLPDTPLGDGQYNLIATVVDTSQTSYPVLNADSKRINVETDVCKNSVAASEIEILCRDAVLCVHFPETCAATVCVYSADGRLLREECCTGSLCGIGDLPLGELLIVKAAQGSKSATAKAILH